MFLNRASRMAAAGLFLAAGGCTSLREIPRSDYTSEPERRNVRVETLEGLEYEFDFARFSADSITGFRRLDLPGPIETYAETSLGYGDLSRLAMRRVNWYRTGLIGGGALVAVVAAGLSATTKSDDGGGSGGGGGRPPGIP